MSRRFLEWRNAVFLERRELLVVSALEGVLTEPHATSINHEAARVLARLCQLRGVHVAILSTGPLSEVALRCLDLPRAWLIADAGQTVRDPHGGYTLPRRRTRTSGAVRHGLRDVMHRLPLGTATIVGVDERVHRGPIAAAHVRPTGLALHVARSPDASTADLTDGIVHGAAAWIELLDRLHSAILLRGSGRTSRPSHAPSFEHDQPNR
jgi:hypothetical protein